MKRKAAKDVLLLTLPVLAMSSFAAFLTLRSQKPDFEAPYHVVRHELLVGNARLTPEQIELARSVGLSPKNAVLYLCEVESRESSWIEKWMGSNQDSHANLNSSSCTDAKTGAFIMSRRSATINGGSRGSRISRVEDYYDLSTLHSAEGKVKFGVPLTWREEGRIRSRTLSKTVDPKFLKMN